MWIPTFHLTFDFSVHSCNLKISSSVAFCVLVRSFFCRSNSVAIISEHHRKKKVTICITSTAMRSQPPIASTANNNSLKSLSFKLIWFYRVWIGKIDYVPTIFILFYCISLMLSRCFSVFTHLFWKHALILMFSSQIGPRKISDTVYAFWYYFHNLHWSFHHQQDFWNRK